MVDEEHRLGSVARRLAATQRVLAVEDEQDIADFLFAYFRASGYDLVHLDPDSAPAVVEAVEEHRPDCILLDLNLRGFNGAEAYRLLRDEPRYAFLPVVVVSARPDAQRLVPARGGIDAFVSKPFHVQALGELVDERIASARRLAENTRVHASGLRDKGYVEARLVDEINVAGRSQPTSFALLRLKGLDEARHQVGEAGVDYVVEQVATQLREALPDHTTLGLIDLDELAAVIPDAGATKAKAVLIDAVARISEVKLPGGAVVTVRMSVGLATHPSHGTDSDAVYMAADSALSEAVEQGQRLVVAL